MKRADSTTEARGNLKYRCKKENAKLYVQIRDVLSRFTTPGKLRECHHPYSSQKNESMNKLISRYVPKDGTFCKSMSLNSRVCLAVGVDSVIHEEYYQRLFNEMKTELPGNTRKMLVRMSNRKKYDRNYQAQPNRKRKRSELKFAKMKDGLKKQMADKAMGLEYARRQNLEVDNDGVEQEPITNVNTCMFCGVAGHKTRRSKGCKYYGWPKAEVEAEMVAVNVARATAIAVATATCTEPSEVQSDGKCYFFASQYDCYNIQNTSY
jgi:hypothetical protein